MSKIKRALISVSDKNGILDFAKDLIGLGIEIISTGGTYSALYDSGIKVKDISSVTDFPEILDGRVKTLHPNVHGGLLGKRNNDGHAKVMEEHGIQNIDLLVVNLYPFEETILKKSDYETCIENIDIGGPAMIRAAAKNHSHVGVVVDPDDYTFIINELKDGQGSLKKKTLKELALKAYARTAAYDSTIANWMSEELDQPLGKFHSLGGVEQQNLRYGENPHQKGTFYGDLDTMFTKLNGKELSYNNLLDVDAAVNLISEFDETTFIVLKHNNACGLASRENLVDAWNDALAGDPTSAFGGVLITNKEVDLATAEEINKLFYEVLIAPSFANDALELLKEKKNRVLLQQNEVALPKVQFRTALNGVLHQDKDLKSDAIADMLTATKLAPTKEQLTDLVFASKVCKHTKSNTIVFVKGKQLFASGVGQTSRVDALKQAVEKAKNFGFDLNGSVMASDAFFPFPDCVELADNAGIKAVIQPGGSIKDQLSIDYCNANNMAMVLTGTRHFKH